MNVAKPGSVNVTEYVPGRSSIMRYCPWSSLTLVRTFSVRAGLAASTVTPGSTAPDVSFTTPAMLAALVPCAAVTAGVSNAPTQMATPTLAIRVTCRLLVTVSGSDQRNRRRDAGSRLTLHSRERPPDPGMRCANRSTRGWRSKRRFYNGCNDLFILLHTKERSLGDVLDTSTSVNYSPTGSFGRDLFAR